MKIIEELEETKRGLYSGAVGYFTPDNDFDFNVVIRSILYNTENKQFASAVNGQLLHFSFNSLSLQRLILITLAIYYGFIASI